MTGEDTEQSSALRQAAEKKLADKTLLSPSAHKSLSPAESQAALHDLEVHRIELEMQNEELRRAQKELEVSREFYFDLYDMAPVAYCTLSQKGLILKLNLAASTLLGLPRNGLIKEPLSRFIPLDLQPVYYKHLKLLFETSEPQKCELQFKRKDQTALWVCLTMAIAPDTDDNPVSRVVISDITAHKQTEESLQQSQERFRYVLENVQDAIWAADLSGKFEYMSPLMARIYGRPLAEMMDNQAFWIDAVYSDDKALAFASSEALFSDGRTELEYRIVLPGGEVRWILDRKSLVRNARGGPSRMTGIVSDITERKHAE